VVNVLVPILHAILAQLKLSPAKDSKVSDEWQLLAMVIDRLCFCIFSIFFTIATLITFRRQIF